MSARLRPLRARLTRAQGAARREKIARRAEEREAARLLDRAKARRKKKEK